MPFALKAKGFVKPYGPGVVGGDVKADAVAVQRPKDLRQNRAQEGPALTGGHPMAERP